MSGDAVQSEHTHGDHGGVRPALASGDRPPPWLPPLLIVIVVMLGYGIGPTRLPLVGEETCRAQHGIEMADTGDWLVPTQQAVPILDRPPLQYWSFAVIHRWIRPLDPLTLRSSMVIVTLATALLIWWYAGHFLSRCGALLAAVAYPTMGHVFDLGRRVETDGLFTLLVAASLMVWHVGYARRWRPIWTWTAGAALAGLAALTKGTQAPVAFFGTVALFLLIRRDWRFLFRFSAIIGVVVFLVVVGIWQVPFFGRAGWEGMRSTWLDPSASRLQARPMDLLRHVGVFPIRVLGAAMPWSPLLAGLADRNFWRLDARARSAVVFALAGMAVIFVPVWLSPEGHPRYLMPMYPLLAVVCGAVLHRALELDFSFSLRRFWRDYVRISAVGIVVAALVFLVATIAAPFSEASWVRMLAQPWWLAAVLVLGAAAGAVLLLRRATSNLAQAVVAVPFVIAAFLAICFNGAVINAMRGPAKNVGPEVIALRESLPGDVRLVSFRPLHHKFVYWYERPIPILRMPTLPKHVPDDLTYFAMEIYGGQVPDLVFDWEEVARFTMDRLASDDPDVSVLVGRRMPSGGGA